MNQMHYKPWGHKTFSYSSCCFNALFLNRITTANEKILEKSERYSEKSINNITYSENPLNYTVTMCNKSRCNIL